MSTLLLIRPEAQSRRLVEALAARGVRPRTVISPVIEIRPRDVALPREADLILTSQNAVAALPPGRRRAWCVGDRTAVAARQVGFEAISAGGDVEALLSLLVAARPQRLVHVRGAHSAGDLAARLAAAGLAVEELVAYDQAARPLSAEAAALLAGDAPVVLPLYSPRSATLAASHAGPWHAPLRAVAISAAAAAAFAGRGAARVAEAPSGEAMERAILAALGAGDGSRLVEGGAAG